MNRKRNRMLLWGIVIATPIITLMAEFTCGQSTPAILMCFAAFFFVYVRKKRGS